MQKAANLARIRDNQRRSRARRKDYLKELETRYRNCEQVGVAASTEIQAAAKGVVEENRRLRNLLRAYGISEAEIDGASGSQGSVAADMLELMATSRQPCGPGNGCQPLVDSTQQSQLDSATTTQPSCQSNTCQTSLAESQSGVSTPQYLNQLPSPTTTAESRLPHSATFSPTNQETFQFLQQGYGMPGPDHPAHYTGNLNPTTSLMTPHMDSQYDGHSSCQIAANSIRTFSPNVGYELEQDLGCRAPGEDCNVSNARMFTVIDRYTSGTG